ncbi:MAG: hypothetical protein J7L73_04395 [Anaerolineales bacterium]|nr:hypothetical protein [Anaerolineales bacterium]
MNKKNSHPSQGREFVIPAVPPRFPRIGGHLIQARPVLNCRTGLYLR